jgi:hypothetical protein
MKIAIQYDIFFFVWFLTWLHFPFVKKKPELFLHIISRAHALMNVTDVSIGSINCDPNNADRGHSIIRVT